MNRIDQQVDEIVCQATRTQVDERGQPGDARWRWVPAKFVRRLHRYTPSAEFEIPSGYVVEQVGWKLYASGKFEIRQCLLQAGEAWAPWTTAQSKERGRRTPWRFPGNRLFTLVDLR